MPAVPHHHHHHNPLLTARFAIQFATHLIMARRKRGEEVVCSSAEPAIGVCGTLDMERGVPTAENGLNPSPPFYGHNLDNISPLRCPHTRSYQRDLGDPSVCQLGSSYLRVNLAVYGCDNPRVETNPPRYQVDA